jgi:hypothetical protein
MRAMRWAGHVARMREKRKACRLLVGKPRCRSLDNIKMDLVEVRLGGLDWIGLTRVRDKWRALVNAVANLRVP